MPDGRYPTGGSFSHDDEDDDDDLRGAARTASRHAGSSGDDNFFGSILSGLVQKKSRIAQEDIDEGGAYP